MEETLPPTAPASLGEPSSLPEPSLPCTPVAKSAAVIATEPVPTTQAPFQHDVLAAQPATLAPWYHTAGIILLLLVYAFVAHLTHRTPREPGQSQIAERVSQTARALVETPKVPLYCSTIMLSWMLLASVVAGLYHRRAFFLAGLRRRFHSRWTDPAIGFGIYVSFLTTLSMLVFLLTAVLTFRAHGRSAPSVPAASQTQPQESSPQPDAKGRTHASPPSAEVQAVQQRVKRMLRFDQRAVAALVPRTLPQMLLWIVLSFTAAFSEEHIFRGYLLGQSLAFARRLALPSWLASALSVLATSVLFGSLHLYEGIGGAVVIALLGAVFAIMALALGNLRAVIVAHFLQDFLGGFTYYIAHLRHLL